MRFKQFLLENGSALKSFEEELQKKYGLSHLRLYKKGNDLILDMIVVPKDKRKQGIGSKVLEDITHYADVNGLRTLLTTAVKDDYHGTTSGTRLKSFYKKFGFVENKGRNKDYTTMHNMIRDPKNKVLKESEELSESISPKKPDKVLTKSKIKNSGTNTAHKIRYKEFTTKNNNKVYVQFKDLSDNGIKIDFEVNDSFDDSNLNDYDVLRNVLYVVLKEVNAKKYNLIELNPKHRSDSNRNNKHIRFDLFRKLVNKYLQDYSEYYVDRTNFGDSDVIILKRKEIAK